MPRQKLPDSGTLLQLKREGLTHAQIAERFGVTENAVYLALRQAHGYKVQREHAKRHGDTIPWTISNRNHLWATPAMMLRWLARREAGEQLPERASKLLDSWLARMDQAGCVVDYDPDQPPNPACKHGGWRYVRRQPEDGDGYIRRPQLIANHN